MRNHCGAVFLIFLGIFGVVLARGNQTGEDGGDLNRCLKGVNHKSQPSGEETLLHGNCSPWSSRSCCTEDTALMVHFGNLYNFDYNHCGQNMSEQCRKRFQQNDCLYECSPNLGPWIVPDNKKIRSETFRDVPLCSNDCDAWFEDCKNDLTCLEDWNTFTWETKSSSSKKSKKSSKSQKWNVCPKDKPCKPIFEIFGTAKNFCEKIWSNSYKYTEKDGPCFRLWFNGTTGENPNDAVAEWKVGQNEINGDNNAAANIFSYSQLGSLISFAVMAKIYQNY